MLNRKVTGRAPAGVFIFILPCAFLSQKGQDPLLSFNLDLCYPINPAIRHWCFLFSITEILYNFSIPQRKDMTGIRSKCFWVRDLKVVFLRFLSMVKECYCLFSHLLYVRIWLHNIFSPALYFAYFLAFSHGYISDTCVCFEILCECVCCLPLLWK